MKLVPRAGVVRVEVAAPSAEEGFQSALLSTVPADDGELADLIEQDGRIRLDRGLACGLDRYYGAVPDLVVKPIALDAAIDISLRYLAQRDGCRVPEERHAESLLRSYPELAGPIRLAALLGNQVVSTQGMGTGRTHRRIAGHPRSLGPLLEDGRSRYELVRALGRGASGTVFEAIDHLLSDSTHAAKVAVKVIPIDPASVQRQAAEATKARRIDHPGVVRVLDRGLTDQDELYLVYELVTGGDLQVWFEERRKTVEPREAARLVAAIARGVQAAHSAGLVHCDLKPSNVLVTPEGEPRVSDFGIAALADSHAALHAGGGNRLPVGSLAFAAPEQVRRSEADPSPLVDVYALGGILYYLVTGNLPNGSTPEEVRRNHDPVHGRKEPPELRKGTARVDERLSRICARALDPRPERRYATAGEMAADLAAWLEHRPIACLKESASRRVVLWARRSPGMATLGAACVVVLLAGSYATGFFASREREAARREGLMKGVMSASQNSAERAYKMMFPAPGVAAPPEIRGNSSAIHNCTTRTRPDLRFVRGRGTQAGWARTPRTTRRFERSSTPRCVVKSPTRWHGERGGSGPRRCWRSCSRRGIASPS